jgi:hypothetical protein
VKAKPQIFLSYAREDKERVQNLYQKLSEAGFNPWMDTEDILPGEKWQPSIKKAIRHSAFFVACLSTHSVNKRGFLQKEIRQALDVWEEKLDSDIYLIPARLESCEVPEKLCEFQRVNLFEEQGWTKLMETIQAGMERQATPIEPIAEEPNLVEYYPFREKPSSDIEVTTLRNEPKQMPETDLETAILEALLNHYSSYPDSPEMTFSELYYAIGISSDHRKKVGEVWYQLFTLQKKGWIAYQSLADGSGGEVRIEPAGIKIARDRQQIITSMPNLKPFGPEKECKDERTKAIHKVEVEDPCPRTLEELVQRDQNLARLIRRDELVQEIKEHFTQRHRFVTLYGQPMVGKTRILDRLSEVLGDKYVPLIVTGQGLGTLENLDAFAFDLADQLTIKFNKWAKIHRISLGMNTPIWNDFRNGWGATAFYTHWHNLQKMVGRRQTVVIIDEIERLLDYPQDLDPRILTFLDDFVRNINNGYFILAGSERIQYSSNEQFSMLIAKGQPIRVGHYNGEIVMSIFSVLQEYLSFADDTLAQCVALCNGHPRLLEAVFEATVSQATRAPDRRKLEGSDIEPIVNNVIERTDHFLWALWQRLSTEEREVAWLISQTVLSLSDLEYTLYELVALAKKHFTRSVVDHDSLSRGIAQLANREWIEWKNSGRVLFHFKLGIFLLWLRRHQVNLDQVRD